MASRTVKSAAGETIEIVPDEEWLATTGGMLHGLRQWTGQLGMKPKVIRALWEHGEFTEASGMASGMVMDWIVDHIPTARKGKGLGGRTTIMNLWRSPLNAPAVETVTKGKRTFSIKLVALPELWHEKLLKDIEANPISSNGDTAQEAPEPITDEEWKPFAKAVGINSGLVAEAEASVALDGDTQSWTDADWEALKLDAPTVLEESPPLELQIANQVAMSMLTTVVEIISAGTADTTKLAGSQRIQEELERVSGLLADRLAENETLRKQLRDARDILNATRQERDGLRTRLRMAEHNLQQALRGETAQAVNSEIQKRIDSIMRQPPASKGN